MNLSVSISRFEIVMDLGTLFLFPSCLFGTFLYNSELQRVREVSFISCFIIFFQQKLAFLKPKFQIMIYALNVSLTDIL